MTVRIRVVMVCLLCEGRYDAIIPHYALNQFKRTSIFSLVYLYLQEYSFES